MPRLTKEQTIERDNKISRLFSEGMTSEEIKKVTNISIATICAIKKKEHQISINVIKIENVSTNPLTKAYYVGPLQQVDCYKYYKCTTIRTIIMKFAKWLKYRDWLYDRTVWIKGIVVMPSDKDDKSFENEIIDKFNEFNELSSSNEA
ncbi:MAG: hypothetical protein ACRCZ0_06580 [Cetobacterium sp.]